MKKILYLSFYFAALMIACTNDKKNVPDVSGIKADLTVRRFDEDFLQWILLVLKKAIWQLRHKIP